MLEERELEKLKERLKNEFSGYKEIAGGKNYRYIHLEAVHKLVKKLSREIDREVDEKVLEIAALYHDIGRAVDIEDGLMDPFEGHEGHDSRGAERVEGYVKDLTTQEQLKKIQKIIKNHHSEAETIEGKIVQDADKLSNFGVNNLWRQIHYASQHDLELGESIDYFWEEAVDEYKRQIERMYFDISRKKAEARLDRHKEAIENIEIEMDAEDI